MFGIDFSIVIQFMVALGAAGAGAYMAAKGFKDPKPTQDTTNQALDIAAALADSNLRNELTQVVLQAREGLQQQVLQLSNSVRLELKELAERDSRGRAEIYHRITELDRRVTSLSLELARIKGAGAGRQEREGRSR